MMMPVTTNKNELYYIVDANHNRAYVTRSGLANVAYPAILWLCYEDDNGRIMPAFHIRPRRLLAPPAGYAGTEPRDNNKQQRVRYARGKARYCDSSN